MFASGAASGGVELACSMNPVHRGDRCFSENDLLAVDLPTERDQETLVLPFEEVLDEISNEGRNWHRLTIMDRMAFMDVCPSGLLDAAEELLSGLSHALAVEGLCESYHALPFMGGVAEQPAALMEAFAVIRSTRNRVHEKERKEAEAKARRGSK